MKGTILNGGNAPLVERRSSSFRIRPLNTILRRLGAGVSGRAYGGREWGVGWSQGARAKKVEGEGVLCWLLERQEGRIMTQSSPLQSAP